MTTEIEVIGNKNESRDFLRMSSRASIIDKIFSAQGENGFWKTLPEGHKYYPTHQHYVPTYRASLWTLVLLADLTCNPDEPSVQVPLRAMQEHFFDHEHGIFSLKEDHFPIPCLNGNMIYLDTYFNGRPGDRSLRALQFFHRYQRFDDGQYEGEKNVYCSNKSCYGKHSCYWGIVKLLKGISFIPEEHRTADIRDLLDRCIQYVLLHKVCFSSRRPGRIMISKMDLLTFPNMYRSDYLEILWLLKREGIRSAALAPALTLLREQKMPDGSFPLQRTLSNLQTSVGVVDKSNPFVTERAQEVLEWYAGDA